MTADPVPSTSCLDAETIAAWVERSLSTDEARAAEVHLADCPRCQALLAFVVRTTPAVAVAIPWWKRPWVVGTLVPLAAGALVLGVWIAGPDPTRPSVVTRSTGAQEAATEVAPRSGSTAPAATPTTTEPFAAAPRVGQSRALASSAASAPAPAREEAKEEGKKDRAANPADAELDLRARQNASAQQLQDERRRDSDAVAQAPAPGASPAPATAGAGAVAAPAVSPRAFAERSVVGSFAKVAPAIDVVSSNPAIRWRIGAFGSIQYSADGGGSWAPQQSGVATDLLAGASPVPGVCWVVGRRGVILLLDGSNRWRRVTFRESVDLIAVSATDTTSVSVTTADGRRFQTADAGQTWTPVQDF